MIKNIFTTAFKGMAMGTIDIVPGVSGGTVAVLLGFYERFIAALKNIDVELFKALFALIRHGFSKASRQTCIQVCRDKDLPWLINLALGIACAGVCASFFIPWLMDNYPDVTRGFFFGLVLGSAIQPILTLKKPKLSELAITAFFAVVCFFLLGQNFEPPANYVPVVAPEGATMTQIVAMLPSIHTPDVVVNLPQNAGLSEVIPGIGSMTPVQLSEATVPAGTQVVLPVIPPYYSFVAGFCAICAMLLPGISGSFILLVLGVYYCALGAAKGTVSGLAHGAFSADHFLVLALLALGAVVGMAVFSRVLTWLFKTHRRSTLAAIVGILLGCLRAVWPFRETHQDTLVNVLPGFDFPRLGFIVLAALVALSIVATALILQNKAAKS